jgi:tetratricopeptide (TPR) repeat protein
VAIYKGLLEDYSGTPQEALINYGIVEANFIYGDYKATSELADAFTKRFHGHKLSDYVQYFWGISLYRMGMGEGGKRDSTLLPKALEKLTLLTKKRNFELAGLAAYFVGNIQLALKQYDEALTYYQTARSRANDQVVSFISCLKACSNLLLQRRYKQRLSTCQSGGFFPLILRRAGYKRISNGCHTLPFKEIPSKLWSSSSS